MTQNGIPVLRSCNIQDDKIVLDDVVYVREASEPRVFLNQGDLLICVRNGSRNLLGKCALIGAYDQPLAFGAFMAVFRSQWNPFIVHILRTEYFDRYLDDSNSTAITQLTQKMLKEFLVPVPPIAEQERIVRYLATVMKYVSNIERSQQRLEDLLKQARSKVLDLAIRGKLVEQDPEDEPASVLLERIHQEKLQMVADGKLKKKDIAKDSVIFRGEDNSYYERIENGPAQPLEEDVFELPESWQWTRLRAHVLAFGGKTPSTAKREFWVNGNIPWVTSKDMKIDELTDSQMHITELAANDMNLVSKDSVLMVTRSGILKRLLPVAVNRMETTINQDLKALVPDEALLSEFLFLTLSAMDDKIRERYHKDGTTVDSLDFDRLINMPIPLPPISEQNRIFVVSRSLLSELELITK